MKSRFRVKNEIVNAGGCHYERYTTPSCGVTPSWNTFYTLPASAYKIGKYSNMDDIVGDRPNRKLGVSGYKFHPVSMSSQTIDAGTGADSWLVHNTTKLCSPPYDHFTYFRRISDGLSGGRQFSGFSFVIDPNGRLIMPSISDIKGFERAINLCVTDVMSKIGRGGSSTNLYEGLAEVDKTLGMVSSYLDAARKIASTKGLISKCKAVGNAYLLTRYGFKPLVSDIFASLEAINASLGLITETTRSQEQVTSVTSSSTTSGDAGTFTIGGIVTRTQTVSIRAMSLNQYHRTRADALGLGAKNLMTVGWELIPYSFVVDWFVNVGDFIGSLTPDFGVTPVGSCLVSKVETQDRWMQTSATKSNAAQTVDMPPNGGSCTATYKQTNRTLGLPLPSLTMKNDFRFSNLTRALDASALLLQRLR